MSALAVDDEHAPGGDLHVGQAQAEDLAAAQSANTIASAMAQAAPD